MKGGQITDSTGLAALMMVDRPRLQMAQPMTASRKMPAR